MIISTASSAIKTYRHEFGKEFMDHLSRFSKVHQYDDRHAYKLEWQKWSKQEDIAEMIEVEKRRLEENGYIGDIDDKMFKAGRYYFRKKTATTPTATATTPTTTTTATITTTTTPTTTTTTTPTPTATTTQRRTYITMSKQSIRLMDDHICNSAKSSMQFKPSECYNDFYQNMMTTPEMSKEIENIIEKYEKTPGAMSNITEAELTEEITDKIKKTYKNRYYKYVSTNRNNNDNNNAAAPETANAADADE
jgi:hypothetical protein